MKKFTYNEVKLYFEERKYKLLSKKYINSLSKLKVQCPIGHIYKTSFNNFKNNNRRCSICTGNKKYTYNEVKSYVKSFGYELLSKEYINNHSKIKVKCDKNHIYETTISYLQQKNKCPICNGGIKFTHDYVKNYIERSNYILINKNYKNNHTKLKIKCPENHIYESTFKSFKNGHRCTECRKKILSKKFRHTYENVKKYIEGEGYELLSTEYINNNTKLKIKCDKGHKYNSTFGNFKSGKRCPICKNNKSGSHGEKQVLKYVKKNYSGEIISNDRNTIVNYLTGNYLELDIYLPELKLAIEYNGDYWHSKKKAIKYDKIKLDECEKLGINLLVIKESEWVDNQKKYMNVISDLINSKNI